MDSLVFVVVLALVLVTGSAEEWVRGTGSTGAAWSGAPEGAGSQAGECGYMDAVKEDPWNSMVTAVSSDLFAGGAACGTCWQLSCWDPDPAPKTIRVVVTDVCRGGPCLQGGPHFELSGHAFGAMAETPEDADKLRAIAKLTVRYTHVDCAFNLLSAYRVDASSTASDFTLTPMFLSGYQTQGLNITDSTMPRYGAGQAMTRTHGAVYTYRAPKPLQAPLYITVVYTDTVKFGHPENLTLDEGYIPAGWEPGRTYKAPRYPCC